MKTSSDRITDDDRDLLRLTAAGDHRAFGQLAERYEQSLLGLARGFMRGDANAACDAVQDVWMRVLRSAKDFRGDAAVSTGLYRITVNACHDLPSKQMKHNGRESIEQVNPAGLQERLPDDDTPLQAALEQLDETRRDVILLCYHRSLTHAQAAAVLEIPIGTLKTRLTAAMEELRRRLGVEVSS